MKLRRLIRHTLTVGSLILSAVVGAVFVRSLTNADCVSRSASTTIDGRYGRVEWTILSGHGFLSFGRAELIPVDDATAEWLRGLDQRSGLGWSFGTVDSYDSTCELLRIGYFTGSETHGRKTRRWKSFELPDWLLLIVVSIPAQIALVRAIRARRAR